MIIELKKDWNAITIKDYFNYKGAIENKNTDDFHKMIEIISSMSDKSIDEIKTLSVQEILPIYNSISFLEQNPTPLDAHEFYDIGGKKYKLITDVSDLTAGQFIDLSHYTENSELIIDNIHLICSVLLLPIVPYTGKVKPEKIVCEKYLQTPIEETSENIFNNLPITEALGISAFFTFLSKLYIEIIIRCLEEEKEKQVKLALKILNEVTI